MNTIAIICTVFLSVLILIGYPIIRVFEYRVNKKVMEELARLNAIEFDKLLEEAEKRKAQEKQQWIS